jgi:uncharacterized protein
MNKKLGTLISGSLNEGFVIRLDPEIDLSEIKAGKFVSVVEGKVRFFCLVSDLKLEVTHSDILLFPPEKDSFLQKFLNKKDLYATAFVKPMLMLNQSNLPLPVKFIPKHFAPVLEVDKKDIALIFGSETSDKHFGIGTPLDMEDVSICLDLEKLTERSNGIFGKTGTGKTFITRLVLAGLIKKDKAVNLIFDMHSEYGLQARKEGGGEAFVKGLKTLFPGKVAIFTLDPASTRRRGGAADVEIVIPYKSISVEDILSLQLELNLHSTALEAAYLIHSKYKSAWLEVLLAKGHDAKEFAQEIGAHPESIAALYRKLKRIEKFPFFKATNQDSVVDQMMEYIDRGISIIVEFGNYTGSFVYLLIANIISRRVHAEYISKTEKFLGSQKKEDEPKKLLITIEEAHKFLNPAAASQTIFGVIAREMRKYYVSLLVVDQRPSGIDQEIISQIGTKIVAQLNDEKDIQAVLTGVAGASSLRTVLASLDSKKQALLMGHALTMPIVVETRTYDSKFYAAVSGSPEKEKKKLKKDVEEIFG